MTTTLVKAPIKLNRLNDRCDRCGAEAFIIAFKPDHHYLLFCGHHGNKHKPALVDSDWEIFDSTHTINAQPDSSA